ncbi:hypothetical protein [Bacillus sp. NTK074B]
MKKVFVLMGIIATLIIAGCSSGSSGSESKDGKVTLTAWAWNVNVGL